MNTEFAGMGFVLAILLMITVLVVVLVWQGFKTWQVRTKGKVEITRDEAYRKLAEEAISVQQKIAEDLSDLRVRIKSMEKMLSEVN